MLLNKLKHKPKRRAILSNTKSHIDPPKRDDATSAGFTIIEVLIVLAIAGLILLIIFIAVPFLLIYQRNTARKQDAARVSTAINTFTTEVNGRVLPGMEGGIQNEAVWKNTDCPAIAGIVGKLAQIGNGSSGLSGMCTDDATQATTNNLFVMYQLNDSNKTLGLGNNNYINWLVYITGAVCPPTNARIIDIPKGDDKQSILIYPYEHYLAPVDLNCLQVT